jgi:hypothetical protein
MKKLTKAQKRNWCKRIVSCYTAGYFTLLKQFRANLTKKESTSIEAMINIGNSLIRNWSSKKEE